jgi:hypothetical protein
MPPVATGGMMTDNLDEVIARADIPDTWDVLIVGDGAGCWWDKPCGWGCTLIDRHLDRRRAFYGAMSSGSIAIAEMMPTVHALLWYVQFHGHARKAGLGRSILNVHVITDSTTTVDHWAALARGGDKARKIRRKRPIWNVLLQFERSGYILHFHWVARGEISLNQKLADPVAALARNAVAAVATMPIGPDEYTVDQAIYMVDPSP